jgi:hypothetical protein
MSEVSIAELNRIASEYQELVSRIRVEQYETPLNIGEESQRTLIAYMTGKRHDPVFEFVPLNEESLLELRGLAETTGAMASSWLDALRSTIGYMTQTMVDSRRHLAPAITERTASFYGPISAAQLEQARYQLAQPFVPSDESRSIDAAGAAAIIQDALSLVSLTDWTAKVESRMNAMMDVSAERREIRIRTGSTFNLTAITRLLVHEVGCHVFRSASGIRQPIQLLGFGLGDYLPTEEGLACYQEEQTGLSDPTDSRRLALRYLAAALSLEQSLFDVYTELRTYADHAQAFETAARAKRGISDTSEPGCHLKDKVYFEGIQAVSSHLDDHPEDLATLYTGNVSLSMLPLLTGALDRGELVKPEFDHNLIPQLLQALPNDGAAG